LNYPTYIIRVIKSRRLRWARHVAVWARKGAYRIVVGKSEGRRPLARPRHRGEDNIRTYLREVGWEYKLDRYGSGYGQEAGSSECGNETFVVHKMREISCLSSDLLDF
jgi:hypothetical protein